MRHGASFRLNPRLFCVTSPRYEDIAIKVAAARGDFPGAPKNVFGAHFEKLQKFHRAQRYIVIFQVYLSHFLGV